MLKWFKKKVYTVLCTICAGNLGYVTIGGELSRKCEYCNKRDGCLVEKYK